MTDLDRGKARIAIVDLQRVEALLEQVFQGLDEAGLRGLADAAERQHGKVRRLRDKVTAKMLKPSDFARVWRQGGGVS
jgi:hypothetical protein